MNKNGLSKLVASECKISQEQIIEVMDALEKTIKKALVDGEQINWGSFLRAWMTERRPTQHTGVYKDKDTRYQKIRYAYPHCEFGGSFVKPLKRATYNRMERGWEKKRHQLLMETVFAPPETEKACEQENAQNQEEIL